jgi:uncharacterized protein YabE (DUF348 family)
VRAPVRSLPLLAKVTAVVALLAGGGLWFATDREVSLIVDGERRAVHTHASTVEGVLASAGLTPGRRDVVAPALDARISDGSEVVLDRARRLVVTVDGQRRTLWTTARSVGQALADLGLSGRMRLSASRSRRLPLDGFSFDVRTEKDVVLVVGGKKLTGRTFAATLTELLNERKVTLGDNDRPSIEPDSSLRDGLVVTITRVLIKPSVRTVTKKAPVQRRSDDDMMADQEQVMSPGKDGKVRENVRMIYANGELVDTEVVSSTTLVKPQPRVVVTGSRPYPADDTGLNWDALADCESGGNPAAVSSGGTYHGLYQFNVEMWQRMGGIGLPSEATPREQTYRAIRLYKAAGADQWPVCGSNLFS